MTKRLTSFVFISILVGIVGCQSTSKQPHVKVSTPYPKSITSSSFEWIPATDTYGSSFDTGTVFRNDSTIALRFTLTRKTIADQWPYIELIANLGGTLLGVDTIVIEYKCTSPLIIKLSQADFNTKGNETYSHYQFILSTAEQFTSATIPISSFVKPDWTPEESKNIPYKPENVDALYFTPDVNSETGGTADLAIRAVYLR